MSHKDIELLEGALLVSDAHYSLIRPELLSLIKDIHSHKLKPTQLILMGDIFDALFGGVEETYSTNREMIELLNEIAKDIEVVYLEGNHDFNLAKVLVNAKVFSYKQQPVTLNFQDQKVSLAHGDFDGSFTYRLYVSLIRNSLSLLLLSFIDRLMQHAILKKLDKYLAQKDDCQEFAGFKEFVLSRNLEHYNSQYFIEGHFHQNRFFNFSGFDYFNLAAFACNQRYFIVESSNNKLFLHEKKFSKGE